MGGNGNAAMLENFVYHTAVHFTDQKGISKTVYRVP